MRRTNGPPGCAPSASAWLLVLGCVLALAGSPAVAQDVPATQGERLTQEEVKEARARVEAATGLDENTRKQVLEIYDRAAEQLKRAAEWTARAEAFERAREEAPERIQALEKELREAAPPEPLKVPEDAPLGEINQRMLEIELDVDAARQTLASLEDELKRRQDRRRMILGLVAQARERLREAEEQRQAPPAAGESQEVSRAQRFRAQALHQALEAEMEALRKEGPSYEARHRLLMLSLDRAVRDLAAREKRLKAWQEVVGERRRQEAEADANAARQALLEVTNASPEVRAYAEGLAEENARLTQLRTGPEGLLRKIEEATSDLENAKKALARVSENESSARKRIETGSLTAATGVLLRKYRTELPNLGLYRGRVRARQDQIANIQVKQIELREERRELADVDAIVAEVMASLEPAPAGYAERRMAGLLHQLLWAKRESLDALTGNYNTYLEALLQLDTSERDLIDAVEGFRLFIDERILWTRSARPLGLSNVRDGARAMRWVLAPAHWGDVLAALAADAATRFPLYGIAGLFFGGWFLGRRRMRARMKALNARAATLSWTSFHPTAEALLYVLLIAPWGPALCAFLGWRLHAQGTPPDFPVLVGWALLTVARIWVSVEVPRELLGKEGPGGAHFGWSADLVRVTRARLGRLVWTGAPVYFFIVLLGLRDDPVSTESLGRALFMVLMGIVATFGYRTLRSVDRFREQRTRTRMAGYGFVLGIPLFLVVVAAFGYFYAIRQLVDRLYATIYFGAAVYLLRELVHRWLLLARRRLAIAEDGRRRQALRDQARGAGEPSPDASAEEELDLGKVHVQSSRLTQWTLALLLIAGVWLIWADLVTALGILDRVELWHTTREVSQTIVDAEGVARQEALRQTVPVTVFDLAFALLALLMTVVGMRNLPGLLEVVLMQRTRLAKGERHAVGTILQYAIGFVGAVIIFRALGIGWGNVQWLVAALGVGIGFGLQEIVANFFSGLIILFEQPIRVGDTVTVGDVSGTVTRIRIRATTITGFDRKELVVPNKEFVVGKLVNWTLSDTVLRITVPVGIAYGSDTEKARETLLRVAQENPRVLKDPAPSVFFLGFGESSLNFELRAFSPNLESFLPIVDELHRAVDQAFREAGITIAFPQRDLHIRSVQDAIPAGIREEKSDA